MDPALEASLLRNWPVGSAGWVEFPYGAFGLTSNFNVAAFAGSGMATTTGAAVVNAVNVIFGDGAPLSEACSLDVQARATAFGRGPFRFDGARFDYELISTGTEVNALKCYPTLEVWSADPLDPPDTLLARFGSLFPDDSGDPWTFELEAGSQKQVVLPPRALDQPFATFQGPYAVTLHISVFGEEMAHIHTLGLRSFDVHMVKA